MFSWFNILSTPTITMRSFSSPSQLNFLFQYPSPEWDTVTDEAKVLFENFLLVNFCSNIDYFQNFSTSQRMITLLILKPQGLLKRNQYVGSTSSNVVGCNMLALFEHYVG